MLLRPHTLSLSLSLSHTHTHTHHTGHSGYKAMLLTDHMLNSPVLNVLALTLERELQVYFRMCSLTIECVLLL